MKLQAGHLPGIFTALTILCEQPISIKTKYWVKRFKDKLQSEVATYESVRREIVSKYGEKDSDGKLVEQDNQVNITDMEGFVDELDPVFKSEISFPFRKIKVDIAELERENVNLDPTEQFTADQLLTFLDMVIEVEGMEDMYENGEDQVSDDGLPDADGKEKVIQLPRDDQQRG